MKSSVRFLLIGSVLVIGFGSAWFRGRNQIESLGLNLQAVRLAAATAEELRGENERLRARQVSAIELDRMRADHAALSRLRAELEELRKRAGATAR